MPPPFRIVSDDSPAPGAGGMPVRDPLEGQRFSSYNEAYDLLARHCSDFCCSDDRPSYRIVEEPAPAPEPPQEPAAAAALQQPPAPGPDAPAGA